MERDEEERPEAVESGDGSAVPVAAVALEETDAVDPEPVSDSPPWRRLEAIVGESFEALDRRLTERFRSDDTKDGQIDRLHAELQEHKRDLLARAVRPVFTRVIRLHGEVARTVAGLRTKPSEELTPERLLEVLEGFGDDLEILLADHGVCTFEHPSITFDPQRQTALEVVETDEEQRSGEIVRRIRPGFEIGQVVLQKERVAVLRATSVHGKRSEAS